MKRVLSLLILSCVSLANGMIQGNGENVSDISKCERALTRLKGVSLSDFTIGLEDRDIRAAKTYWEVSDNLLKTLGFCHFLGRKRIPIVDGTYVSSQAKVRLLKSLSDWMTPEHGESLDSIMSDCANFAGISDDLLRIARAKTESVRETEELHLLQIKKQKLEVQLEISQAEKAIMGDNEAKAEHLRQMRLKPLKTESDILAELAIQEKSRGAIRTEEATRSILIEQQQEETREKIALAKKNIAQHKSDTEVITFTQEAQIEQKLNALREQIETSLTAQNKQRIDRKFAVAREVFSGLKVAIDTLADDFSKVGGIFIDYKKTQTGGAFEGERAKLQAETHGMVKQTTVLELSKARFELEKMQHVIKTIKSDVMRLKANENKKAVRDDIIATITSSVDGLETECTSIVNDLTKSIDRP